MKDFTDKVAAITGAGSGIGQALAVALARRGAHLALSDIDAGGLESTAAQVRDATSVPVTTALVDVADREAVFAWAADVVEAHGRANLIVNNAGVALAGTVEDTPIEDYEWILGVNLWGVIYGTKAFLPHLRAAGEGHVVNISSVFGLFAQPTQSGYNASKFAVRGFTESLRQELDMDAGDLSATSVHPGGIDTDIARNARLRESTAELLGTPGDGDLKARAQRALKVAPAAAAEAIVKGVQRNARRVLVGRDAYAIDVMQRTLPSAYQRVIPLATKLL